VRGLRLSPAIKTVGLLCFLHICLPGADTTPTTILSSQDRNAVFAEGERLLDAHSFADSLRFYQRAGQLASSAHDSRLAAKSQFESGACLLHLFRYRAAIEALGSARDMALRAHDPYLAAKADINVTTVYLQLGEYIVAEKTAKEAARLLENSGDNRRFVMALMNYAWVEAEQDHLELSRPLYRRAINLAQAENLPALEASAWNHLGESLLDKESLPDAEQALVEAYRLYLMHHDEAGLAVIRADLALLDYKQGKYESALAKLQAALSSPATGLARIPSYLPLHLHGEISAALHRDSEALEYFQKAVDAADDWRGNALPGDVVGTHTVAYLHAVYHDFAEFAAQTALKRHDSALAARALSVLSENRAANLREELTSAFARQNRLPAEYFDLLNRLKVAEAHAVLAKDPAEQAKASQIRMELSEVESRAGLALQNIPLANEKKSDQKSLRDIQLRLSGTEVLLSFCLGKNQSYLWVVTRERVILYELPPQAEVARLASQFSDDVQHNRTSSDIGGALSRDLFGKLDATVWKQPEWIVVGDGPLLNALPFAALPAPGRASAHHDSAFLGSTHTLRLLPTERFLLSSAPPTANPAFVGIGDPVYNLADSRRERPRFRLASTQAPSGSLARLAGSEREITFSARFSGLPVTEILTGRQASSDMLRTALASRPQVIHFAVHVVSPEGHPEQAALALSLNAQGIPELLPPEMVATYRVPGSLVVLSGCASQQGQAVPSAGLIGLSRAWLLAGASAVIVSAWPTPDDSGHFFSSFYSHLQADTAVADSLPKRAAAALQYAQADMRRDQGYRGQPSFWAAYSIISKE
jgi:CHAT domain-containing protein